MKKMEYIAPEEQVIKMVVRTALLDGSGSTAPGTGDDD
jgi:hypothetical protein